MPLDPRLLGLDQNAEGTLAGGRFGKLLTGKLIRQYHLVLRVCGCRLAVIMLPTTSWPQLRRQVGLITEAIDEARPGEYREVVLPPI